MPTAAARTVRTDVVVVGSGFGGSTAALRLVEKGYDVQVLEAGRRFADDELPRTSWDLRRYLWAPQVGCFGLQRIHLLPDVLVMAGAGVGGGSLNFANTLYKPPSAFFQDPQWGHVTDWEAELSPYYDQASRMLGVVRNPTVTPADDVVREVAEQMGVADTVTPTPVGVFFGEPGRTVEDPFFGGAGPQRTGCTQCGGCMTGCRVGAKNTLVKNYLHLAERGGAVVHPLTTVTGVRPGPGGGWVVEAERTRPWGSRRVRMRWECDQVVLAAGTYGTQRLLHAMKDDGTLPALSPRLGHQTRTNSEAVVAATRRRPRTRAARAASTDFSRGVAITSSFHLDERTHVEPVRYGPGSNVIGLLQTVLVDGGGRLPRWAKAIGVIARDPAAFVRSLSVRGWSERTVIALVMLAEDNSLVVSGRRSRLGSRLGGRTITTRPGQGEEPPRWIPGGHEVARRAASLVGGDPGGAFTDVVNIPMTAHFLGGCPISTGPQDGVVDPYLRVHGYPSLHVVDGSAISANLGVNPSLSITAQAERATALWPNKGEADPRPAQGESYATVAPVAPGRPVVPAHAPGALRLPLTVLRGGVTPPATAR